MKVRSLCTAVLLMLPLVPTVAAEEPAEDGSVAWNRWELVRLADRMAAEQNLESKLVRAVIEVESGFNPRAVSHRGAQGLMQLMPSTARRLGVEDPFDPEQNVKAGTRELRRLLDRYAGDLVLALAAYNAGQGAVDRHGGVPPYGETRRYVRWIMSRYTGREFELGPGRVYRRPVRLVRGRTRTVLITNMTGGQERAKPSLSGGFGN